MFSIIYYEDGIGKSDGGISLETIITKIEALNAETNLYIHIYYAGWIIYIHGGHLERIAVIILNSGSVAWKNIRLVDNNYDKVNEEDTIMMKDDTGYLEEVKRYDTVSKEIAIEFIRDFVKLGKPPIFDFEYL